MASKGIDPDNSLPLRGTPGAAAGVVQPHLFQAQEDSDNSYCAGRYLFPLDVLRKFIEGHKRLL